MKKIILYINIIMSLFLFACSEQEMGYPVSGSVKNKEVSLLLNLTNPRTVHLSNKKTAKAGDETTISNLLVVTYKTDGTVSEVIKFLPADLTQGADATIQTLTLSLQDTNIDSLHVVINAIPAYATDEDDFKTKFADKNKLSQIFEGGATSSPFVMWGVLKASEVVSGAQINVIHNVAKTTVESTVAGFVIEKFGVVNISEEGTIAPKNYQNNANSILTYNSTYNNTSIPTDADLTAIADPIYFYETAAAAKTKIVIKVAPGTVIDTITSKSYQVGGYYAFEILKDDPNNSGKKIGMDLLRNHYYKATICKVLSEGYSDIQDALNNPSNLLVDIIDISQTENIKDFVFNGSYALGLVDSVMYVDALTTSLDFKVITSFKAQSPITAEKLCTFKILDDLKAWGIVGVTLSNPVATQYTFGTTATDAYFLDCKVTFPPNNMSELIRDGKVTFYSGTLERTMTIRQRGNNLKTDPNRTVKMFSGSSQIESDYWDFLKSTLKGVKPTEMRDSIRNEGLHFNILNNDYSYKIAHLPGDAFVKKDNAAYFDVSQIGSDFVVTLTAAGASAGKWKGYFTVTSGTGATQQTIRYDVYHTGVIQNESGTFQNHDNVSNTTGWFYYEAVKVDGKYWLDRNLGASSNGFYSEANSAHVDEDKKSVGGYFRLADNVAKDGSGYNIAAYNNPCPSGFDIPTMEQFQSLQDNNIINLTTVQTTNGAYFYNKPRMMASDENFEVYFPMVRFFKNSFKDGNVGGYYWTSTVISGNQGFDPKSKEYAYWYRYVNFVSNNMTISNARFVNGSNGTQPATNPVYRAHSIRCIQK